MFQQIFAIIRNTFFESIRQPIMLVILVVATIAIIFSNPLSAFTMANDQRMLIDLGLATVFLCGALLAAFIATNVLGREIENRTALTVVSKPISRPIFVIGKYLGVAAALALGTVYMSFVFMLVEQHGVLQTVRDPIHVPVIVFGFGAAIIGLGVGIWCNYFYGKVFSSTVICTTTPLAGLAYLFSMMFRPDFSLQPMSAGFRPQLWLALAALLIAILVLTAIAVAASTRLSQVLTLVVTLGVFMMGMLSDWFFGRQLVQLEQTWSQRVDDRADREVQSILEPVNVNALKGWVADLYRERAERELAAADCDKLMRLFKAKTENRSLSEADRRSHIQLLEVELKNQVQERHQAVLDEGRQMVDAVNPPLSKQHAVHKLDWASTVARSNGECETIRNLKTFIYPPLLREVATGSERMSYAAYRVAHSVVPNFQVLLLSDAVTQDHAIPVSYVSSAALYGLLYVIAALSLATLMFQRREVG